MHAFLKVRLSSYRSTSLGTSIKPWPNGLASLHQNLRTDLRWETKRIRKSQKAVNCTHIQITWDQLVSTCFGRPNGEKLASTFVRERPAPETRRRNLWCLSGPAEKLSHWYRPSACGSISFVYFGLVWIIPVLANSSNKECSSNDMHKFNASVESLLVRIDLVMQSRLACASDQFFLVLLFLWIFSFRAKTGISVLADFLVVSWCTGSRKHWRHIIGVKC